MEVKRFNIYLFIYLLLLLIFGIFFLWFKHGVVNDSTISEWLINYQGGFTRRGLIGKISFIIAKFFGLNLRDVIFIFQSFIYITFIFLTYNFLKDIKPNFINLLLIFTPIFILYPIAEIEVLARKELFLFISFILFLKISSMQFKKEYAFIYIFFTLPIVCLIWEPVFFFFPFVAMVLLLKLRKEKLFLKFLYILCAFLPSLIVLFLIIKFPLSDAGHAKMVLGLKEIFNENCYMSCELLKAKAGILNQFKGNFSYYFLDNSLRVSVFIRYLLIILIGFGPLFILSYFSVIKDKAIILLKKFNSLIPILLLLQSPVLILFSMASDWGRWVNISYTFSVLFYFYLVKNSMIEINYEKIDSFLKKIKKEFLVIFFIIFAFGWNPKTAITGDIASFPGYRIPIKVVKFIIFKFNN